MKRILSHFMPFALLMFLVMTAFPSLAVEDGYGGLPWLVEDTKMKISTTHGQLQSNGEPHVGFDLSIGTSGVKLYAPFPGTVYYVQKYGDWLGKGNRLLSYGNMALLLSDEMAGDGTYKYAMKFCHLQKFPEQFNAYKLSTDILPIEDGELGRSKKWGHPELNIKTHEVGHFHLETGDLLGYGGGTGNSSGPHCHVELKLDAKLTSTQDLNTIGRSVDPEVYFVRSISALEAGNRYAGCLDLAYTVNGQLRLAGWALNEKKPDESIEVEAVISLGGQEERHIFTTDQYRSDIGGGIGNHGFDVIIPAFRTGTGTVSLYIKKQDGKLQQIGDHAFSIRSDSVQEDIAVNYVSFGMKSGDTFEPGALFNLRYKNYSIQERFAYWAESKVWGVTGLKYGAYKYTANINEPGLRFWMDSGCYLRLKDGRTIFTVDSDETYAWFLMLRDDCTLERYAVSWEILPTFLGMHGGAAYAERWDHVGPTLLEGECTVTSPVQGGVQVSGWVSSEKDSDAMTIVVNIGGVNHTLYTLAESDHVFHWLISTAFSGRTLVVVTAKNNAYGDDLELFRGYVDIPMDVINRDCVICIDRPGGTYEYNASPEISGWIVSNVEVTSLTAGGIVGMQNIDLTASLQDASGELNNAGYGSYRYKKRFSGVIPRDQIINGETLTLSIQAFFANGTRSEPAKTSFALKTLVIYDGTNVETWFSNRPGGPAMDTFAEGDPIYLFYRLTSVDSGWMLDAAHPDYAYTVRITVTMPDGVERVTEYTNDENWILVPTQIPGHYDITLTCTGDARASAQTLWVEVPSQITPKTRIWMGYSPDAAQDNFESCAGSTYYGHYQLLDRATGKMLNASASQYNYTVTMEMIDPQGTIIASKTLQNADSGYFAYTLYEAGPHLYRLTVKGEIEGMDAGIYDYSRSFTVTDDPPALLLNATAAVVEPGPSRDYYVTKHGWTGANWDIRVTLDQDTAKCAWVSPKQSNFTSRVLQITFLREGTARATLELYDTVTQKVYATKTFVIHSNVPTYTITYDANGGSSAPVPGKKRKGEDFQLSRLSPACSVSDGTETVFRGWSPDPSSRTPDYLPGSFYTADAPVTLYAVWEPGMRYTYDTNGGKNGPESEWHSTWLESSPYRLSSMVPERLGFIFQGWSLNKTATTASYSSGGTCTRRVNTTLYAVWKRDPAVLDSGTLDNGFEWVLGKDHVLFIQGTGAMPSFSMSTARPWDGLEVRSIVLQDGITSVGSYAFYNMSTVTDLSLPESLTKIGSSAFSGCKNLSSLRLPSSLSEISGYAFENCFSLAGVRIPDSVTSVGSGAFQGCTGLREIQLSARMTRLPSSFLSYCTSLEAFTVPGHITRVDAYALSHCDSLKTLIIQSGVTVFGNGVLAYDKALESVSLPDTLTSMGTSVFDQDAGLTSVRLPSGIQTLPSYTFRSCTGLTEVQIPQSVRTIGNQAFEYCRNLLEIGIPEGVTSIGSQAFHGCTRLGGLTLPATLETIGARAFVSADLLRYLVVHGKNTSLDATNTTALASVTVWGPSGGTIEQFCLEAGIAFQPLSSAASPWDVDGNGVITGYHGVGGNITVPSSLHASAIGEEAFRGNETIRSITLPASITSIGKNAFRDCTILRQVTCEGNGSISIGTQAFSDCTALQTCILPGGSASIGTGAFYNCTSLARIQMPARLTGLGSQAFYYTGLQEFTLPGGITTIPYRAFGRCEKLTRLDLPEGITTVGEGAFWLCEQLTTLALPETITTIGASAFSGCQSLTSLHLPHGVKTLETSLLNGCSNLVSVHLPEKLETIRSTAFRCCYALSTLDLPDTLKTIEASAFELSGICVLHIPGSVTELGSQVFDLCRNLEKLILEPGVTTLNGSMLTNCTALKSIGIPYTVSAIPSGLLDSATGLERLYTSEDSFAENWFRTNMPSVSIEYLWLPAVARSVSLNYTEYTLGWLNTRTLKATVLPALARNTNVIWTSSNPEKVSVDTRGRITAHQSSCSVVITATTEEGGYQAKCLVTVPDAYITLYYFPLDGECETANERFLLRDGMLWPDMPVCTRPGWQFTGWYLSKNEDAAQVVPGEPMGWGTDNIIGLYAHYLPGVQLDPVIVYVTSSELGADVPLPDAFLALAGTDGAVISSDNPDIAIASEGQILGRGSGDTVLRVSISDGGFLSLPVHVVTLTRVLTLPDSLQSVEDGAFQGNPLIEAVCLPDSVTSIGSDAFRDCPALQLVRLPASLTHLADDAFDEAFDGTMLCVPGSTAESWCQTHGYTIQYLQ